MGVLSVATGYSSASETSYVPTAEQIAEQQDALEDFTEEVSWTAAPTPPSAPPQEAAPETETAAETTTDHSIVIGILAVAALGGVALMMLKKDR